MGQATLSGPVAMDEERLESAARNSSRKKGEQKRRVRLQRARGSA